MKQINFVLDKLYVNPVILSNERMDNLAAKIKLAQDNLESAKEDNDRFDIIKYSNRINELVQEIRKIDLYKQFLEADELDTTNFFNYVSQLPSDSHRIRELKIFLERKKQEITRMEEYDLKLGLHELLTELFQDASQDEKRKVFEANEDLQVAYEMLQDLKLKGDFDNYTIIENEIKKIKREISLLSEKIENQKSKEINKYSYKSV